MRVPHVLVPATDRTLHHLRRVLRLRPGAQLSLTDGSGGYATGVLTEDGIDAGEWRRAPRPPAVTLCAAISKGTKLDIVVEKATELGVAELVPVSCARSERRWDAATADTRLRRWNQIAVAALEQSRGLWLPTISAPTDFETVARTAQGVVFHPGAADADFGDPRAGRLAVGPEGGLDVDEIAVARERGWIVCGLGSRILRTETAAIAVCTLALAARGGFTSAATDPSAKPH